MSFRHHAGSILVVLLAVAGIEHLNAQSATPIPTAPAISIDGHWESNWGDVRIENVQQQRDGTYHFYISWFGLAESGRSEPVGGNSYAPGIYNPKNGQMSFRYLQTSFNGADRGTASLTASVNGRIVRLSGSYQHDSGRRGYWQMARRLSVCPGTRQELLDLTASTVVSIVDADPGCKPFVVQTSCQVLSGVNTAGLALEVPEAIALFRWATIILLAVEAKKPISEAAPLATDIAQAKNLCPCQATTPRSQAMKQAYAWAGIPIGGGGAFDGIPWRNLNMSRDVRYGGMWAQFLRTYPEETWMGWRAVGGKAMVQEHPFGHPEYSGLDDPDHHVCPHFHARNPAGIEAVIEYKQWW
jgi:hypothetical protein